MSADVNILLWINSHHTDVLDTLMWYATKKEIWLPLYLLLTGVMVNHFKAATTGLKWKDMAFLLLPVLAVAAAAGLADFISSGVLKPLIERPRPSRDESLADVLRILHDYRGGHYGFPSSHAADTMAVATSFLLLIKRTHIRPLWLNIWRFILLVYVVLNCYSRMYLGVHYPTDIAVGLLIGALTGWGMAFSYEKLSAHLQRPQ